MSLIGKALAPIRNAGPPVPVGSRSMSGLSGLVAGGPAPDEALMRAYGSNGTSFANISMLATSTAAPEWKLYRKDGSAGTGQSRFTTNDQGSDQRTEVTKHAALDLLNQPAVITVPHGGKPVRLPVFDRFLLFELGQLYLEITGRSFWVLGYDPRATIPLSMWPVRPDRMMPVPDASNFLAGWIYTSPDGREQVPLMPTEVIWSRYPDPLNVYGGVGPLGSVLTDVDAAGYAAQWNRNWFINSAEPGGVIQVDHTMEDDEWNQFINRWRESHRGVSRAHRVAVLDGNATWVPNEHNMKDMDFANLRTTSRDVIREALGMHKVLTGVSDDVNRANAQTGEEVFAAWKVRPRLDRWKGVLNNQLLPLFGTAGDGVEFDYLQPTPKNREQDAAELTSKTAAWAVLVGSGADPDDAADVVGLPRMKTTKPPPPPALPPAPPPAPAKGEQAAESAGGGDMAARLRTMLANGHLPVGVG